MPYMRAWKLCSTGFITLSTAPARYGMFSILEYRIYSWQAEGSHPHMGLEDIAALRHLAACDYSMVIIPSYERISLSHWAKRNAGMTPSYPVTGLYSIIYGTLFCFLTKHKGEGYAQCRICNGMGHSMARYLLNPFPLALISDTIPLWNSGAGVSFAM